MEMEEKYGSRGATGAGLGLGIAGTALGLLNGGLNGILGGRAAGVCPEGHMVNRFELEQNAMIESLKGEIKLRDANVYTLSEMGKLRDYVDGKFEAVNAQLCQQAVINSQTISNLSCLTNQVAVLQGLTKTVIPATSICPEVMPRFNSFTVPTTDAAAAG